MHNVCMCVNNNLSSMYLVIHTDNSSYTLTIVSINDIAHSIMNQHQMALNE